jgi:predicted signal transduction protein with EAL and GGDEF domain
MLGIAPDTSYWAIFAQLIAMSTGLGLLVPPLTSALLGSVEKSRSGIAAGVLNATRQTGSMLGVALFGSLVGHAGTFMSGLHASLIISAGVLFAAGVIELATREDSMAIGRAVTGLGKSLGIVTTAEGVETDAQFDLLRREGCMQAQRYLFSPPRPAAEVEKMLAKPPARVAAQIRAAG